MQTARKIKVQQPERCVHCDANIWFDDDSETYETKQGVYLCPVFAGTDQHFTGHEPV